jgi:hypothetical protein
LTATATDRGLNMLNQRKSLLSSQDSLCFIMLPLVVDVVKAREEVRLDVRG